MSSFSHFYCTRYFLVGIYLICILATSMLSLMVTILTLRLFHHDVREPVPTWLQTIIRFMPTVTCQGREKRLFNKSVSRRVTSEVKPEMVPEVSPEVKEKPVLHEEKFAELKRGIVNGDIIKGEEAKLLESSPWETSARIFDRFFAVLFFVCYHCC